MSYPIDLDEYRHSVLQAEIDRRTALAMEDKCTYCERPIKSDPPCKFPTRHEGKRT